MTKKNKNIGPLITVIIIVALLAGVVALFSLGGNAGDHGDAGQKTQNIAPSEGALNVATKDFDFGTIKMADGKVTHDFTLSNTSDQPVTIKEIFTSCMCTEAELISANGQSIQTFGMPGHGIPTRTDYAVAAKDSITIKAIFDPAAHGPEAVGPVKRIVTVKTNSTSVPELEIKFAANVINPS